MLYNRYKGPRLFRLEFMKQYIIVKQNFNSNNGTESTKKVMLNC